MSNTFFRIFFPLHLPSAVITLGLLFAITASGNPALPSINTNNVFNVTNAPYNAKNDGVTVDTTAIQNAINDAANASGGGTVEVPAPGTYLCGPLAMKSKVNLQIDSGAMLQFLPESSYPNASGTPAYPVGCTNLTDLEISGSGAIDGNGAGWWSANPPNRPYMIYFSKCYRVLIQNVTLQNAPKMHVVFKNGAGDITIQGITINTDSDDSHNTDGIDLVGTNCLIQNCYISDGDDNIALGSSGSSAVSSGILITNCAFGTGHGVSIGSNTAGGVSNLTVINCSFNNTDNGIRMKSDNATSGGAGEGGIAQNLYYYNLHMTNITYGAIIIYSYYNEDETPIGTSPSTAAGESTGSLIIPIWRNIVISNLTATVASGSSAGAGIIWGRKEAPVTNVIMSHVSITAPATFDVYNAYGIQFVDFTNTLPGGNNTFTIYNADIIVTNDAPGAGLVTFDGLTSTNSLALYQAPASLTAGDAFGANPITLAASTLTDNTSLTVPGSTVFNFALGTNATEVVVAGNLTLNNTLNIAAGDGFSAGAYTLFTYSGSFSGSPVLGTTPAIAGYTYSLTNSPGSVRLLVQAPAPPSPPSFGSISATANGLVMSGSGGTTNGTFYVMTSTNIALPLNQWTPVATNRFDAGGNFIFTNAFAPNTPQAFYILQVP
ncbi:MAG TPA: glycosyl hydrolase family 28 protein [Candidatus Sulfopaludibacter sp.]|nr:glycosyl hydrolase family 28 protein [Candidatus Sulfopaludibacter sp.]